MRKALDCPRATRLVYDDGEAHNTAVRTVKQQKRICIIPLCTTALPSPPTHTHNRSPLQNPSVETKPSAICKISSKGEQTAVSQMKGREKRSTGAEQ